MTDGLDAPDFFDPARECFTHTRGETHNHICRRPRYHAGTHTCTCGHTWTQREAA